MKDKNKTESSEIIFSEKTATPFYFSFDEDAAQHTMILSGRTGTGKSASILEFLEKCAGNIHQKSKAG